MTTSFHHDVTRTIAEQKSSELRARACRAALVRRALARPQR